MKHIPSTSLIFGLLLLTSNAALVTTVHAQTETETTTPTVTSSVTPPVKELKTKLRQEQKEMKEEMKAERQTLKNIRTEEKAERKNRVTLTSFELVSISGTTLTVSKDGKTYTITTSAETKFRRNFGGQSSLSEFAVGNILDVRGEWTDETKTTIAARAIHNRSIMKRFGAFVGEITAKTGNTFTLKSVNRNDQTVTVTNTTKYVNRKMEAITLTDVVIGHRVRVKGMWDKSNNTITEVTQVKDYSLPLKTSPTPIISE